MSTYMILGGGGSFGIHTALHLLYKPETTRVFGVGRNPLRPEPFSLNIETYPRYSYHTLHITYEFDMLLDLIKRTRPDYIINFAAQGEGAVSWSNSWRFFETNCVALSKLFEELLKHEGVFPKKFIQIGTSELYGAVSQPSKEDDPIRATSPYAASKAAFDMYLLAMGRVRPEIPFNIIRPSNAYCPGQLLHRVIPRAMWSGVTGQKMPLRGGGAKKSYIHARDLAEAIYRVCHGAANGEVFNVGPEAPISILSLVEACANTLNMPLKDLVEFEPARPGEDAQYWLESSKIKRLGWKQQVALTDGLYEMRCWAEKYREQIKDWPTAYTLRA